MSQTFFLAMAVTGVSLLVGGAYLIKNKEGDAGEGSPATNQEEIKRLKLSEASNVWTDKILTLAMVSTIWVETEEDKAPVPRPSFKHDEIDQFWSDVIESRASVQGFRKAAIAAILKMLDQAGDCPSVVRNPKHNTEVENKYSAEAFGMLSEIPLWQHSLDVARNIATRVGRESLIPDALITALAHDLGKIPTYHEKGYTTGDHSIISSIVLGGIHAFCLLSNKTELELIVRSHHHLKPTNAIATLLKECDQITRNNEIAVKMRQAVAKEQQPIAQAIEERPQPLPVVPPPPPIATNLPQPEEDPAEQRDHPLGHTAPDNKAPLRAGRANLPWFEPEKFLSNLKQWINVVANGRYGAVSMPDGLVYVHCDCMWNILNTVVPDEHKGNLLAAAADETTKRSIMHSAVWTLSETRNAIAADMIKPEYHTIPVVVINGSGKATSNTLMIPFRAEAFGELPSTLESTKSIALRKMVKSIKPKLQDI